MKQICSLFFLTVLWIVCPDALAQQRKAFIAGMVKSEAGVPIPGVFIQAYGLKSGDHVSSKTNEKGVYRIDNLNIQDDYKVSYSCSGFETYVIKKYEFKGLRQTMIAIKMKVLAPQLNVGVETGYVTEQPADFSGAIEIVDVDALRDFPVAGIDQALQGRVAGVNVMSEGQPGGGVSVRIRGYSSVGNNDPLYVVDGVPVTTGLQMVPFAFVKHIQVLKDASAAAIYGSRAANGVVIITTKKGEKGEKQFSYHGFTGLQKVNDAPELLDAQQFGNTYFQALKNDGILANHTLYGKGTTAQIPEFLNVEQTIASGDTNWYKRVYNDAPVQSHHLLLSSGSETGRQALGLGYYEQDGLLKYTGFKRYSMQLNTDYNVLKWFKIGENVALAYAERTAALTNVAAGGVTGDVYKAHPMASVYDISENFAGPVSGLNDIRNPLAQLFHQKDNVSKNLRVLGNVFAELTLFNGLTLRTSIGLEYNTFRQNAFYAAYDEGSITNRQLSDMNVQDINSQTRVWTNTLNYTKASEYHRFGLLLGAEDIENQVAFLRAYRDNFPATTSSIPYLNGGTGTQTNSGSGIRSGLFSLFAKANYSFRNRFLLTATARRDQFSQLTAGNNTLIFPGLSAGWRISEYSLFKEKIPMISNLKFRLGWGRTGNLLLAPFSAYSSFGFDPYHTAYAIGGANTVTPGVSLRYYGNEQLKLEKTTQFNYGLDLGFFDNRFTLSADYFIKDTEDLMVQAQHSAVAGQAAAPYFNGGAMRNRGLEMSGMFVSNQRKQFKFEIGGNIAFLEQRLTSLSEDISFLSRTETDEINMGFSLQRTAVGLSLASFYGHQVLGVFQTAAEVTAAPTQTGKALGRLRYADLNGDNMIDDNDRTYLGSPIPAFTYGFNFRAAYKSIDLSVFFQGVAGNKIYNFMKNSNDFFFDQYNKSNRVLSAWTPENTTSSIPSLSTIDTNNELRPSSYFIEDGTYLRLKNVQLGISLPLELARKISVAKIRVFAQGHNIFTFTKYSGLDPEVGLQNYVSDDRNLDMGVDRGLYPNASSYSVGLNIIF